MPISKEQALEIIENKTNFLFLPWNVELGISDENIKLNQSEAKEKIESASSLYYSKEDWFDQIQLCSDKELTVNTLIGDLMFCAS